MSAHTPGPWTARAARSGLSRWVVEAPHSEGGLWYVAEADGRVEQNAANARLIAAAPDLLGALTLVTEYLSRLPQFPDRGMDVPAIWQQARAAIKRAESGQ